MKKIIVVVCMLALVLILQPASPAEAIPPPPEILSEGLQIEPLRPSVAKQVAQFEQQGGRLPNLGDIAGRGSPVASPPTGTFNLLVVLVDFSDNVGVVAPAFFDSLVFAPAGSGVASVTDYFDEVSYGNLTFVTLDLPSATNWQTTNGWLRAPGRYNSSGPNLGYVNPDGIIGTPDDYGFGNFPNNLQGIVFDTFPTLDGLVDLSQYDNDGDGFVDGILYVYAGPGAEVSLNPSDIWSSAWNMTDGFGPGPLISADGVYVDRFAFDSEYMLVPGDQTIGIYCHEIGHLLFGMPDLYDYDYSSAGVGQWSLMAVGSWNDPAGTWTGSHPAWPDAWSRMLMGFETPTTIYDNYALSHQFQPVETLTAPGSGQVLRLESPVLGPEEYFLVEYRDKTVASYDSALPGSGLLIWHVDEGMWNPMRLNTFECRAAPCCNCPVLHPLVALAQADGNLDLENVGNYNPLINYGDATDPFNVPGQVFAFGPNAPESGSYYNCANSCIAAQVLTVGPGLSITADIDVVCTTANPACLDISVSEPIGWAMPGQEASYEVSVRNCGNAPEPNATLSVPPGGWPVSFFDLSGTPILPPYSQFIAAGATWRFEMRVGAPAGMPRGFAYAFMLNVVGGNNGGADQVPVDVRVPNCILLVDDDQASPGGEGVYRMALQASQRNYDDWDTTLLGRPDAATLAAHEMVIWFTGGVNLGTLFPRDEMALASYLDGGGSLLLSSQDYLWDVGRTPFNAAYLQIRDFTENLSAVNSVQGVPGHAVFGQIPLLPLVPPTALTDEVIPLPSAAPAFESIPGPHPSGITYDSGTYKVLFLAWPLENRPLLLPPQEGGIETVLAAAVNWMGVPRTPMAGFTYSPAQVCSGSPVSFTNTSTDATDYLWELGNGITSTLASPTHTYTVGLPITHTVILHASNCCGQSVANQSILVNPWPVAEFDASGSAVLIDQAMVFTNTSRYADAYLWDFGDGFTSTLTDTTHAYSAAGVYTVTMTATNACQASIYEDVVLVFGEVVAGFSASATQASVDEIIYFTNQSLNATSYRWDFGDGSGTFYSSNASHAYSADGTYTVTLTASNLLSSDTAQALIEVTEDEEPPLQSIFIPTLNRGAVGGLKAVYKP